MAQPRALPLAEKIDPATMALVVIDVQNDFCHADSPLARQAGMDMSAAQAVVPRLLQLVDAARGAKTTIDTDLELILRSRGIKTLIMSGVATNVCVGSTARDAYMRDYHVVFVDDCSATYDAAKQAATLRNMDDHFGVVVRSADIFEAWQRVPAAAR